MNTPKAATAKGHDPLPVPDNRPGGQTEPEVVATFPSDRVPMTPTDEIEPRRSVPARGRRMRVLGQGEGDFCIFAISDGGDGLPLGSLIPIPGIPRFQSTTEAKRWIVSDSGDLLANRQVMVFKACDIITVTTRPTMKIELVARMKVPRPTDSQEVP